MILAETEAGGVVNPATSLILLVPDFGGRK
jgi:hypothetical protein